MQGVQVRGRDEVRALPALTPHTRRAGVPSGRRGGRSDQNPLLLPAVVVARGRRTRCVATVPRARQRLPSAPPVTECWNADVVMYARGIAAVEGGQDICIGAARAARRAPREGSDGLLSFCGLVVILSVVRRLLEQRGAHFRAQAERLGRAATHAEWARRAGDGVGRVQQTSRQCRRERGRSRVGRGKFVRAIQRLCVLGVRLRPLFRARARSRVRRAHVRSPRILRTRYPCTSVGIREDVVAAGYSTGHLRIFRTRTSELVVEVAAHSRCINAIDVAAHQPLVRPGAAAAAATRQKRRDRGDSRAGGVGGRGHVREYLELAGL